MIMETIKAVGYLRVSTEEQKEGLSLDNQESRLKGYAVSQGLALGGIYRDEGFSAKDCHRPELQRLLNDVENGNVDLILVYRLDRLTRSMRDLYSLLDLFKKHCVAFKSISEDFSTNTPVGKVVLGILGLFAEWERDIISGRIRDAMAYKRKVKKEWVGACPYGYRITTNGDGEKSKFLSIDEHQALIVKRIFRERTKGKTLAGIVEGLKAQGINSRKWSPAGLFGILRNESYLGANGTHRAIISKRLFNSVQGGQ